MMDTKKALLAFRLLTALFIIIAVSGCTGIKYRDEKGTIHHLIIGMGIVSIPKQENKTGAFVSKTEVIGVHASNQPSLKLGVGYSASSFIAVPESTENIVIEVSQKPLGPLTVDVNPSWRK